MDIDRDNYAMQINSETCSNLASYTVLDLLSRLGKKLKNTLPAILIGNIITSVITNLSTPLQIGLAVLLHDAKEQVTAFHDFGVTCSYDEILRYKRSAASAANKDSELNGIK